MRAPLQAAPAHRQAAWQSEGKVAVRRPRLSAEFLQHNRPAEPVQLGSGRGLCAAAGASARRRTRRTFQPPHTAMRYVLKYADEIELYRFCPAYCTAKRCHSPVFLCLNSCISTGQYLLTIEKNTWSCNRA